VRYQSDAWRRARRWGFVIFYGWVWLAVAQQYARHPPTPLQALGALVGLVVIPIAAWMWRTERMGLVVTPAGVELIGFFRHTHYSWEEVIEFKIRGKAGWNPSGVDAVSLRIRNRMPVVGKRGVWRNVPTVFLNGPHESAMLRVSGVHESIGGDSAVAYLNQVIAEHRPSAEPVPSTAA
jgi:hypothetical protein